MALQHTEYQQAPQKDQARYDSHEPEKRTPPREVEVERNCQEPELNTHEENAYDEAHKEYGHLSWWRTMFNIACRLTKQG